MAPIHSIVEMSNGSKKYGKSVIESDNQRVMSRNLLVFAIQIDYQTKEILYKLFKNLHFNFSC